MTRKVRYGRLIILFIVILFIVFLGILIFNVRITNIYINNNFYLTDQEIIENAKLQNYPKAILANSRLLESNISKNELIKSVNVEKKFTKVYIDVVENRPLFYNNKTSKTILSDGSESLKKFNVPLLVNDVNLDIYAQFLTELSNIDISVYDVISEIEYVPNAVDNKLFLFTMNDGNYVYINLEKFDRINMYFDMVVNFNNHKGILYLDSGEYFKILDN